MILRDELLATEETAWHALHQRLGQVPDARWGDAVSGDWSLKDVVAHIACWHSEAVRHLECIRSGNPITWPEVEKFNAAAYAECLEMTVKEVKAMAGAARHRLREELAIAAPVALSSRLVDSLRDSMERHYAEHRAEIDAFVATVSP